MYRLVVTLEGVNQELIITDEITGYLGHEEIPRGSADKRMGLRMCSQALHPVFGRFGIGQAPGDVRMAGCDSRIQAGDGGFAESRELVLRLCK